MAEAAAPEANYSRIWRYPRLGALTTHSGLNVFNANGGDGVASVAAAYFRRASRDGYTDGELAVIESAYNGLGQIEVYPAIFG